MFGSMPPTSTNAQLLMPGPVYHKLTLALIILIALSEVTLFHSAFWQGASYRPVPRLGGFKARFHAVVRGVCVCVCV